MINLLQQQTLLSKQSKVNQTNRSSSLLGKTFINPPIFYRNRSVSPFQHHHNIDKPTKQFLLNRISRNIAIKIKKIKYQFFCKLESYIKSNNKTNIANNINHQIDNKQLKQKLKRQLQCFYECISILFIKYYSNQSLKQSFYKLKQQSKKNKQLHRICFICQALQRQIKEIVFQKLQQNEIYIPKPSILQFINEQEFHKLQVYPQNHHQSTKTLKQIQKQSTQKRNDSIREFNMLPTFDANHSMIRFKPIMKQNYPLRSVKFKNKKISQSVIYDNILVSGFTICKQSSYNQKVSHIYPQIAFKPEISDLNDNYLFHTNRPSFLTSQTFSEKSLIQHTQFASNIISQTFSSIKKQSQYSDRTKKIMIQQFDSNQNINKKCVISRLIEPEFKCIRILTQHNNKKKQLINLSRNQNRLNERVKSQKSLSKYQSLTNRQIRQNKQNVLQIKLWQDKNNFNYSSHSSREKSLKKSSKTRKIFLNNYAFDRKIVTSKRQKLNPIISDKN